MNTSPPELPAPAARTPVHTRRITYQGFRRDDGDWDFEARIEDTKQQAFTRFEGHRLAPDEHYHHMVVRLRVDDALTILAVDGAMRVTPYPECQGATPPLQELVGATLGRGWRRSVDAALGGTRGCTHVREMLYNLATVAIQTVPAWLAQQHGRAGADDWSGEAPPPFVGGCHAWRRDGAVVLRLFPRFHEPAPKA